MARMESQHEGGENMKTWLCFHCDEIFTDPSEAAEHFGNALYDTPACQLTKDEKGLVGLLREAHFQLRRYQDEDSQSYREFYSLGAAHSTALMREEEKGYARGLADGRALTPIVDEETARLKERVRDLELALDAIRDKCRSGEESHEVLDDIDEVATNALNGKW